MTRFLLAIFIATVTHFSFAQEQTDVDQPIINKGEQLYLQHCSDCHGISGMGTVGNPKVFQCFRCQDTKEITAYIDARMPPDRRHDCVGDCAKLTTEYILGPIASQPPPQFISKKITARRLNKRQYTNTVQDLIGVDFDASESFPDDDFGNGFDRMGDVLSLSPLQFELYLKKANELAEMIVYQQAGKPINMDLDISKLSSASGGMFANFFSIWSTGAASIEFTIEDEGDYDILFDYSSHPGGEEGAKFTITINGKELGQYEASMIREEPQSMTLPVNLSQGVSEIEINFINDFWDPDNNIDRNLLINNINIAGPTNPSILSDKTKSLIFCNYQNDINCAQDILSQLASKAWRRTLTQDELNDIFSFYKQLALTEHSNAKFALSASIELILSSPNFIFQLESLPEKDKGNNQLLNQYAIASRLSYFLWDSMPDDELFDLAKNKKLTDKHILKAQVNRMLISEKSNALLEGFLGQWLLINAMSQHSVDKKLFPEYKKGLNTQLVKETQLLFLDYMRSDKPFKNILTNNYTYANKFLANYYGFKGDFTKEFSKVSLNEYPERWGLLSQASLLTVTSHPNRTSVVKRGKWIMSNFLCQDPPPPPPGVEGISEETISEAKTLREQMQLHAGTPQCRSCHITMDAIGFAFEQYDAIGRFRTSYDDHLIDPSGSIGKNKRFDDAQELANIIQDDARFKSCVTKKLYTYALSSGITPNDELFIKQIVKNWDKSNGSFSQLVQEIVTSEAFMTHSYQTPNYSDVTSNY